VARPEIQISRFDWIDEFFASYHPPQVDARVTMVRGNAKALAQAKNEKKAASKKEAKSDLKARGAALKVECGICKAPMINYHQLKQHYDSKHPKETCPPDPNAS
jgi:hypothetical protein|tara:strand:+ start:517 stop:828 length:312 start_codon:yes stop_codon:yes gene_type:complete